MERQASCVQVNLPPPSDLVQNPIVLSWANTEIIAPSPPEQLSLNPGIIVHSILTTLLPPP